MRHEDALEALHTAAVEPGGLDRLMAGDTVEAAAFVGHLAGCDVCATELERLRRSVPLLREVVRTTPPADLRERTLAYVREHGEVRDAVPEPVPVAVPAAPAAASTASPETTPVAAPVAPAAPAAAAVPAAAARRPGVLPWVASVAAAALISVVATNAIVGSRVDSQLASQQRTIDGLEAVTSATLAISAAPDAERVALGSGDGSMATGSLLFSPSTSGLVVVASGIAEPPSGKEYRCWALVDGARESVGRMYFANDLAYWAGDTPAVAALAGGTTFGVSLTDVGGTSLDADPVLVGET